MSVGGDGEGREGEKEEVVKVVKKTLFQRSNSYPQKKVLTFNRYSKDFPFSVYYSHLEFLNEEEKTYVHVNVHVCISFTCPGLGKCHRLSVVVDQFSGSHDSVAYTCG